METGGSNSASKIDLGMNSTQPAKNCQRRSLALSWRRIEVEQIVGGRTPQEHFREIYFATFGNFARLVESSATQKDLMTIVKVFLSRSALFFDSIGTSTVDYFFILARRGRVVVRPLR
jgi:hypothetical protein